MICGVEVKAGHALVAPAEIGAVEAVDRAVFAGIILNELSFLARGAEGRVDQSHARVWLTGEALSCFLASLATIVAL